MHPSRTLDVGMDVHHDALAVASVANDPDAAVVFRGAMGSRPGDVAPRIRTRQSKRKPRVLVYEAGPGGDWLSRDVTQKGHICWVVAPSLIPKTAGDRVNTDRRDAGHRARVMRSGALTPVYVPQGEDEAIRDVSRAREATSRALKAATCRLNACLLRPASRSTGQATWGPAPRRWLSEVVCASPAPPLVVQAYVRAVHEPTARRPRLAQELHEQVPPWRLQPVGEALQALRGVPCPVAVPVIAARGDLTRVDHPSQLRRDVGLTPAEYSSGERRCQGAITQTGNSQARHALVDGAWAYRDPANVSRHRQLRLEKLPQTVQEMSGKAQGRRGKR